MNDLCFLQRWHLLSQSATSVWHPPAIALDLNKGVNTMTGIWLTSRIILLNCLPLTFKEEKWQLYCHWKFDMASIFWEAADVKYKVQHSFSFSQKEQISLWGAERRCFAPKNTERFCWDQRLQRWKWLMLQGRSETSIFALFLGVYTWAWSNSHAIMHALNYTHYALNLRDFCVSHQTLM